MAEWKEPKIDYTAEAQVTPSIFNTLGENEVYLKNVILSATSKINNLVDIVYPIGSTIKSINNINPSTLIGGTWKLKERELPIDWIAPELSPIPLTKDYMLAGLNKSIIDMKGKAFRFKKANYQNVQMMASEIRRVSPGTGMDIFTMSGLTPFSYPQLIQTIPNLPLPWKSHLHIERISVSEDISYYYVFVSDYFIYYDPSEVTSDICNIPIKYFVNCSARKESLFEYCEFDSKYEWERIG